MSRTLAPTPSAFSPPAPRSNDSGPAPVLLICVIFAVTVVCTLVLTISFCFVWRRISRAHAHAIEQHRMHMEQAKGQNTRGRQYRLPVVVQNPGEVDFSYGRKESSYFPSFFRLCNRPVQQKPEGPDDKPVADGAFICEGQPGYFEVDLEMAAPTKSMVMFEPSATASPQALGADQPADLKEGFIVRTLSAASRMLQRPSHAPEEETLDDSAHAGDGKAPK